METNNHTSDDDAPLLGSNDDTRQDRTSSTQPKNRLITVEPAVLLGIIYIAGTVPLLQQYCYSQFGNNTDQFQNVTICKGGHENNSDSEDSENAQHKTSLFLAQLNAVALLPVFITSCTIGSFSDKVGRKVGLLFSLAGLTLALVVYTLVIAFKASLYYLFIGKLIEGFSGGYTLFLAAAFSYIADITTVTQRQFRIIALEIVISFGVVISGIGLGYLIKYQGFLIPSCVMLGVCMLNFVYCVLLPESRDNFEPLSFSLFFTLENLKKVVLLYVNDTESNRRWKLQVTAILVFTIVFLDLGKMDVVTVYVLGYPFCFSPVMIGYLTCCLYLISGLGSVVITKILENKLHEMTFLLIGILSSAVVALIFAVANSTLLIFLASLAGLFSRLPVGMIRAYNSKLMDKDEQGAMFASIAWLESTGTVIGLVTFDAIYSATLQIYNGLVFLIIVAGYVLVSLIASLVLLKEKKNNSPHVMIRNVHA